MTVDAGNFRACLDAIVARGKMSAAEALDLLNRVADRAEQFKGSADPMIAADPFGAAARQIAEEGRAAAIADRADALRNAAVRAHVLKAIQDAGGVAAAPQSMVGRALGLERMSAAEMAIRSLLHGMNVGDRDNIESLWKGNAARWQGVLSWRLKKAGLEKAAISGVMDRDIATALWKLNAGEAIGETPAEQAATIVKPMLDHVRARLNAVGARIGAATDYVATTIHDPGKIRRAGGSGASADAAFKAWWDFTAPRLAEKTFADMGDELGLGGDPAARAAFGRSVFDALVSGVHLKFGGADDGAYIAPAFEGTRNLARKLSQSRVLFWKDGASWQEYMAAYGRQPSVMAGIMSALDRGARQLALMEKLGTNPAANLNMIVRRTEELYRGEPDRLRGFQDAKPKLDAVMAHLDGSANVVANQRGARWSQGIRTWETVSDLGGVGLTHFASIWPTVSSEMVHHGYSGAAGRLYVLGRMAAALLKGKGDAERQEILADLGAYAHGLNRDMFHRWQAEDMLPGKVSALANQFMKYTGIHYVFDNTQAAIREMLAHRLGRSTHLSFDQLDPPQAAMLERYGIGAREWDQLRGVADLPVADGMRFMTPDSAMRIEGLDDAARWSLADKLASYYNDAAAHGVVTPGVRERAAVLGKERPGTLGGELRRFLFQFKMWPLAAAHQVLGRDIWLSGNNRKLVWNLGTMMALTTAAGYLRMTVNDLALGNEPRNPLDPKTLLAALAQGGGLGIYGDFLFGEHMRMDAGLVGTLGGPVVSDADTLVNLFNQFRGDATADNPHKRGRFSDLWPQLARFAVRHVPFANYVYLKGALDYLLWYHLYEAASPGWWERANRRMAREQGRVMAGYTPGGTIPWTPWGIGNATATVPARR